MEAITMTVFVNPKDLEKLKKGDEEVAAATYRSDPPDAFTAEVTVPISLFTKADGGRNISIKKFKRK